MKAKPGQATKLANRGHVSVKMLELSSPKLTNTSTTNPTSTTTATTSNTTTTELSAIDFDPFAQAQKAKNLYADSTVPCFFRRPAFSPDGLLLLTPTGTYRNIKAKQQSFCTHIYSRALLATPVMSLIGLEDPSVAVRFSPVVYLPITQGSCKEGDNMSEEEKVINMMIPGSYRYVY